MVTSELKSESYKEPNHRKKRDEGSWHRAIGENNFNVLENRRRACAVEAGSGRGPGANHSIALQTWMRS